MFAIFGPTGKVGSATVESLLARGAPVRAVVHDASSGERLEGLGCEVVAADLRDVGAIQRALLGVTGAQVICPMLTQDTDAAASMGEIIDAISTALRAGPPTTVLAISDYGAQLDSGTGITLTFHRLEATLRDLPGSVTFLRSAEHMHNWSRFVNVAIETGELPSLHQPATKAFPAVSPTDVGVAAAGLLTAPGAPDSPCIVHIEGPRRHTALDVASMLSELAGREIRVGLPPRKEWVPTLRRGGLGTSYAELVAATFDANNAGRIDAESGAGERLHGTTEFSDVLASLLPAG